MSCSCQDCNGITLPLGLQGSVGEVGPTGPQGVMGLTGPQGPTGATGATGATGPAGSNGANGANGVNGDQYTTTSATSIDLSTFVPTDPITITVGTGLAYAIGQTVIVANSLTDLFDATISAYNSGTGQLDLVIISITGTGTFVSWAVALNGAAGPAGRFPSRCRRR